MTRLERAYLTIGLVIGWCAGIIFVIVLDWLG
jgi:hypothetical protein